MSRSLEAIGDVLAGPRRGDANAFAKLSTAESRRLSMAQRLGKTTIEFDPDSKLSDDDKQTVLALLTGYAKEREEEAPKAAVAKEPKRHRTPVIDGEKFMDENGLQRQKKRLAGEPKIISYVLGLGFTHEGLEHFGVGVAKPYQYNGVVQHSDVLVFPLRGPDGEFYGRNTYAVVPGISTDNRPEGRRWPIWSSSEDAYPNYADGIRDRTILFVCENVLEMGVIWSALRGSKLAAKLALVCSSESTQGPTHPRVWKDTEYWEKWERVYAGHAAGELDHSTGVRAGDQRANAVARKSAREVHRVWPKGYASWGEYFKAGKTPADFEQLLLDAQPLSAVELEEEKGKQRWFAANPVDLIGGYSNGYLYEVCDIGEEVLDDETGEKVQRMRTWIIRSDRTKHYARQMPAPKGTPIHQVIHRLWPDGTVISGPPRPRPSGTWSVESIQRYLDGKGTYAPLAEQIERIAGHLKACVWLPYPDDYTLLACTVVVTYVQSIFDAVPLLLATGAPGTGKSRLGGAMVDVSANAPPVVGAISAASLARLIDQCRGFVAIDDVEQVAAKRGDGQFDDFIQALKLAYAKATGTKLWTNTKTMRLEKLNFFGVKMIGNTRGVDDILGSRMFTIATKRKPKLDKITEERLARGRLSQAQLAELKDELHTWAFTETRTIADTYGIVHPNQSTRSDEIAAPLRVVAKLAGSPEIEASLQRALEWQARMDVQPETPEQLLREALIDIVTESVKSSGVLRTVVTITEVMMRMAVLVDPNYRKSFTNELSEIESAEWVGRQLKQRFVDTNVQMGRLEMYGKFLRPYQLMDEFVAEAAEAVLSREEVSRVARSKDPKQFCAGCTACPYRSVCEMRSVREARESTAPDARH